MRIDNSCLVFRDACASWRKGNLRALLTSFEDDLVFSVHARRNAPSLVGEGFGKNLFAQRLEVLLDDFTVREFEPEYVWNSGFWHYARVRFLYQHRVSGLLIDGTMRYKMGFVGDKIGHFQLFHDSDRMHAFLEMASAHDT
jgi:hypothetical protein